MRRPGYWLAVLATLVVAGLVVTTCDDEVEQEVERLEARAPVRHPPIVEPADPAAGLELALVAEAFRPAPTPRASRSSRTPQARVVPTGDVRTVSSTAYCLTGTMANGQRVYRGAVAMNGVPMGSVWRVRGGGTYTVADRIGHSSGFDIAMPGECAAARAYGRRTVTIERVG